MAYQVRYRRRAERDLRKLAEAATADWLDGLTDAIESLAEFPDRCPFCRELPLRTKGIRQLLYGEGGSIYRILYRAKDETVQILTIRHAHRQPLDK